MELMSPKLYLYWRVCAGGTFLFLIFITALNGALAFIPILLCLFACRCSLSRWLTDVIVGSWLMFAPAVYELLFGVRIKVTGDMSKLRNEACSLVLLNHRTRLDWLFILSLQARYASLRRFKISLKYPLRFVPGGGWAMQIAGFLFLKRTFDEDKGRIENILDHFKTWKCGPQLLLFPEGTDFREDSWESSNRYAKKNELPMFDYVLHPRTTGFISMVDYMTRNNNLDQVVDVTIGYPQTMVQNEDDLLTKRFPEEIWFRVRVFNVETLPQDSKALTQWLIERWEEKENILKIFYEEKIMSSVSDLNTAQEFNVECDTVLHYVGAMMFWMLLAYATIYACVVFTYIRWYFLFSLFVCAILGHCVGVENLLMKLDRHWKQHK